MTLRRSLTVPLGAAVIALAGVVLVACTVWPGFMSADSLDQFRQARAGSYDPWHPPLMAWTWHWTNLILPGPGGLLLLENAMLWGSIAVIAVIAIRRSRWGWLALTVGFFPPIFVLAGHLWKDVLMAAALTLAVALLAIARDLRQPAAALWALAALFYATALRHNANTATLPLIIAAVSLLLVERQPQPSKRVNIALGVLLAAFLMVLNAGVSNLLTGAKSVAPLQSNFLHDLVGISRATNEPLLPESFQAEYPHADEGKLRSLFRVESSDPIVYDGPVKPTYNRMVVSDLRRAWLKAVLHHPWIWFKHRVRLFQVMIGLTRERVYYPYHSQIDTNDLGLVLHPSALRTVVFGALEHGLSDSLLYRGWAYLLFAIVVFAHALWRRRVDMLVGALFASIFLYLLPFLLLAPAPDFRYIFWPVLGSLLLPWVIRRA